MSSPDPRHEPENVRKYDKDEEGFKFKKKGFDRSPEYRGLKHAVKGFKKQLGKTMKSSKARNAALDKIKK